MRKSAGGALTIELLRPMEWIEAYGAQPGSTIHLDLHEMGAVGDATVIAINDCPPIQTGVGTVVTGKFVHQCVPGTKLVHLRIAGQSEPTGVTDNHPYWSVDRHDFVPVGELRVAELIDTEFGPRRVESITPWTGFDGLLYNLETTEHVFRVGTVGSLVHNSCGELYDVGLAKDLRKNSLADTQVHHVSQSREAESLLGNFNPRNKIGNEPAIRISIDQHTAINAAQKARGASASARDLLANDIGLLRKHTDAPNSALKKLIELNKDIHRSDFLPLHRIQP